MFCAMLVCVCASLVAVCLWRINRTKNIQKSLTPHMPNWPTLPIFGNALYVIGNTELFYKRLIEANELADKHNGRFRAWLGQRFVIITIHPEDVKVITNTFIEKPYFYSFARVWAGNGLVTAPGHIWKKNIKILSGTFTSSIVEGFQDVFNKQANKLVEQLKTEVGAPPFDVLHKYLAFLTFETICETGLGVAGSSSGIGSKEYYNTFVQTIELIVCRAVNILYHPDIIYKLTPTYRKLKKNVQILHNASDLIISKRKKERNNNKKNVEGNESKVNTYLDILLSLKETNPELDDDQIRAEVDTVIVGGQETTAATLTFLLLFLGSNPKVQKKLYDEMKEIFGDSNRKLDKEDLPKMKYCEAVINETLRLYPPIPAIMRHADKDLVMDGYTIPKGTELMVSIVGIGRSKAIWGEDAELFKPERWVDKQMPVSTAFIPFSYGRRACIGKKYAMASLKTLVAYCVRELRFTSDISELKLKCDIAIRPVTGHLVEVHSRN